MDILQKRMISPALEDGADKREENLEDPYLLVPRAVASHPEWIEPPSFQPMQRRRRLQGSYQHLVSQGTCDHLLP